MIFSSELKTFALQHVDGFNSCLRIHCWCLEWIVGVLVFGVAFQIAPDFCLDPTWADIHP